MGDVTGLPGRLVSARIVRDRGRPPLELETVTPVDGIVPANTNFSQEEGEAGGADLSVKYYPPLLKLKYFQSCSVREQKIRNNIERDYSQLYCFETIPPPFLKKNFQSEMS